MEITRTAYQLPEGFDLSLADLHGTEELFSLEETRDFKKKLNVLENIQWESLEQRALAEKIFKLGYLAAHINLSGT